MCVFRLNMMLCRHGRGDKELQLASCPSGPTRLVGFDSFSQKRGEATQMFWKDHLPPCPSLPYQLAKMAALAPLGADAIMPVECPTPLGVATGPRRRSLAQVGSGGSSFLDKGQFLSTTAWPPVALDRHRWNNVCHPAVCTG